MNSAELKRAKRTVRRAVLAARDEIPPAERERKAAIATERFLGLPEVRAAGVVMAFWSFGSELNTLPLLRELVARGVTVALPCIVGGELEPRAWRPGEPMTPTSFGALEPSGGDPVMPGRIDVVATPGVAFDRTCRRVGYGGGFYDRFFSLMPSRALRAGLGFDAQLVDGQLPQGHVDLPVDAVVTDLEVVRCREPEP